MSFFKRVADKIGEVVAGKIAEAVGAGILAALGAAWLWLWYHVDPQFDYTAKPSSLSSHFVSLGQVLNQIDKDSKFNCSGGLDQRISAVVLRSCYHFTFIPQSVYRMIICTHDQRVPQISTSDQLRAIRHFESQFTPLQCFRVEPSSGDHDYNVVTGKDSLPRNLRFGNDSPEEHLFCGCSTDEITDIARTIGATLK